VNEPESEILTDKRGRIVSDGGPFGRVLLPAPHHAWELPLDTLPAPADWNAVFGRTAPLVVEIGCGGGRTIMALAGTHPEWNCMGIERCGEYYRIMSDRAERKQLANFRCARIDAAFLIRRYFQDATVAEYHIYFPDPWPKKRHLKRRLFNAEFCAQLQRTLAPGGTFWFATDYKDYYDEIRPLFSEYFAVEEHPQPWPDAPLGRTNFEVKYMLQGRPIYRLIARPR
jgi:tRNA (guanine-N7-)-methyltransferase